ncbi:hypothetical protein A2960_06110 [Candidatus Gottesmanbacteria bacterium RIFCSPLOWO2_01_FULL_39_12b]|uniref:Uncharacterized protein n=1 Tax=Candidatus Gottesmanbacteria bacterium RIFCSPLOWO2_01_FULL_39_12b TaxID=1798388 RepID=A0A1F6AP09_9BACT|nr:MAG: hypothetical protein A2960_06110 [Candidatus Gottesmanbacteria bacterium RIFCSPLOWO2_01_FULL_39_12b]
MQTSLPYLYGQIEYLEKNLSLLKKTVVSMARKKKVIKSLYGSLPKVNLSFTEFNKIRKIISSTWENEWK